MPKIKWLYLGKDKEGDLLLTSAQSIAIDRSRLCPLIRNDSYENL